MSLVTKTMLAAQYSASERTIDRWIGRGLDLGRVQVGGKVLFDEEKAKAAIAGAQAQEQRERDGGSACLSLSA